MVIRLVEEKETKNKYRFAEVVMEEGQPEKMGLTYVPKSTLDEIGWKPGMMLKLELSAEG